jgi:hypothetical protein
VRIVHIQRSSQSPTTAPTYDIIDAGRYDDEESGFAEMLRSLRPQQVGDWLTREGLAYSSAERVLGDLEQTGSAQVQLVPRVGPRIVRAWFDTVINPLLQALESELHLLERRNWTFSHRTGKLELIRPLRGYLAYDASANLEQILKSNTTLEPNAARHDEAVERLRNAVASLHELTAMNLEFRSLCGILTTPEKLRELGVGSLSEILGAYPPAELYNLIAQDVVNNSGLQSPHFSTAEFWNRNRGQLMKAVEFPGIRERYGSVVQLGEALANLTLPLLAQIKTLRDELSLRYDVPLVTSSH